MRLEARIKREFEKLHEFLRGEERALLARLQEESWHKRSFIEDKMNQLTEESRALLDEAHRLEADLEGDDCTLLLVKPCWGAALCPAGCHSCCGTLLPLLGCEQGAG